MTSLEIILSQQDTTPKGIGDPCPCLRMRLRPVRSQQDTTPKGIGDRALRARMTEG